MVHSICELHCLTIAQFGKKAPFYHQILRGYFVSGINNGSLPVELLGKDTDDAEVLISGRTGSRNERDKRTVFGKNRFTLLVCEIWRAQYFDLDGGFIETVFCSRTLSFPPITTDVEEWLHTLGRGRWWKELDCYCLRVAGFTWSGDEADGSDGGAIIESIGH